VGTCDGRTGRLGHEGVSICAVLVLLGVASQLSGAAKADGEALRTSAYISKCKSKVR
jgi:hypothetical protein